MTAQQFQDRSGPAGPHDVRVQPVPGGFVLRGTEGSPLPVQLTQGIVLAVGAAFAAGALVILLSWDAAAGHGFARVAAASLMGGMALLMLWFATRGGVAELHLDLAGGELREVVRHRIGAPTVVARHPLGGSPALVVDGDGQPAGCALILRTGGEGGFCIAQGSEADILDLRRRLDAELRGPRDAGLGAGPLAA